MRRVDVFTLHLPVLGAEKNWGARLVGRLLIARAVISLLSRVFLEAMHPRLGSRTLLVLTVGLAGLAMSVVPLVGGPLLFLLMVPPGVGLGLAQPITMA